MTDTVLARGCEWCESCLHDGWGADTTPEQAETLGGMVVSRFEELARLAGSTAVWFPKTSEVIGDIADTAEPENLEAWRVEATQEVWEGLIDGKYDKELGL